MLYVYKIISALSGIAITIWMTVITFDTSFALFVIEIDIRNEYIIGIYWVRLQNEMIHSILTTLFHLNTYLCSIIKKFT